MKDAVARAGVTDDPNLWQENVVELVIDPLGDCTSYCQFFVNSEGSWADMHASRLHMPTEGYRWNSGLTVKVEKGADSWTAELHIPLSAFPRLPKRFVVEFARERNLTGEADYEEQPGSEEVPGYEEGPEFEEEPEPEYEQEPETEAEEPAPDSGE